MPDYALATIQYGTPDKTVTLLELARKVANICDTDQDDVLTMYLQIAGEASERYIDNTILQKEVTEQIAKTRYPVALRYGPYQGSLVVTIDGTDVTSYFEAYKDDGLAWVMKPTSSAYRSTDFEQMTVTYEAGHNPLPPELGLAIARAAVNYMQSDGATTGALKRESVVGVGTWEYATGEDAAGAVGMLPASTVSVLQPYRRYSA